MTWMPTGALFKVDEIGTVLRPTRPSADASWLRFPILGQENRPVIYQGKLSSKSMSYTSTKCWDQ